MNNQEHKRRFALTLLFSLVIFCILMLTIIIAGATVMLLVHSGIITIDRGSKPSVQHAILFTTLISMLIGLFITMVTSRIPLSPINTLIDRMNHLASGKFDVRLDFGWPITKHPTFTELSNSLNTMAGELENTEMLRSDFINNFSHEFKTPIVSIAGFAKLLKRGNLSDEQRSEYLDAIEEESLRLSQMATNVLNLTKVENQSILSDLSTYNISEQIRSSLLLLEPKWSKKHLDLEINFDEHMVSANEELMKEVWINLLDNAIKFSPEYGTLLIEVNESDDDITVSITNTGDTIPEDKLTKIFNKFYQADESHSSEGNGIGLAIVSRIIDLHKGNISVESKNNHTTFMVRLPQRE